MLLVQQWAAGVWKVPSEGDRKPVRQLPDPSGGRGEQFAGGVYWPIHSRADGAPGSKNSAEWLPSDASYHCAYAAIWVGTKPRWDLAVDEAECQALIGLVGGCPSTVVSYEPASA
ncbi:hypothetical protein ACFQ6B_03075 [Streptomyces wedmorensis]|uniref:DUF1524 domain-containing protein n=1 Tax=Streptomyces wedmorensis TaxID=43759 RepID=A0ABW6J1S4_STRWE